jgi:glucose/arabinose dehydrogenase
VVSRRTLFLGSAGAAFGVVAGCSRTAGDENASSSSPEELPSKGTPSPAPTSASSAARAPSASPSRTAAPRPKVTGIIADNLDVPWGIAFLRSGDALVSERNSGRVVRISKRGKVSSVGDVAGVVVPSGFGEGGLMGIALAPDDEETLFAHITTGSDDRVVRCSLAGRRLGRPKAILTGIPTGVRHHGGRLLFDRQGMLLVATGDAANSSAAQDKGSILGKILRIRPDGRAAPGNPYGNRVWSYGHRNVEGLAFDANGRLWATEFGEQKSDELNLIVKGKNYGWPRVEGRSDESGLEAPKLTWSPTSSCSPAGLAIVASTAFVGALRGQCLFAVPLRGTAAGKPRAYFAEDYGRIRSVAAAPDGTLWMTTSNTDGRTEPGRDDDLILRVSL